eukprot:COSAG02_NODE_122_length_35306_cov_98.280967_24_plen_48_part_00
MKRIESIIDSRRLIDLRISEQARGRRETPNVPRLLAVVLVVLAWCWW